MKRAGGAKGLARKAEGRDPDRRMAGRPVLLLETDDETTAALVSILESDGFPVVTARSLFQAEEEARRAGPAVLLIDLQQGPRVLDPMEVEGLRRVARGCPVVTLIHRSRADVDPAPYAPAAHLLRPLELDDLLGAVRKHYHAGSQVLTPVPPSAAGDPLRAEVRGGALWLSGGLDERTTLERMLEPLEAHAGPLKIDCTSLRRVNSTGVRIWIFFVRALAQRGIPVTLRALSPSLVAQAKLIDGVLGPCNVESFQCMLECKLCHHESHELVDTAVRALPIKTCASCGGEAVPVDDVAAFEVLFAAAPARGR